MQWKGYTHDIEVFGKFILMSGLATAAGSSNASALTVDEAKKVATDAYVYGYSLLTTEVTWVQMTSVDKVGELHAPVGQFFNIKRHPPATIAVCSRQTPIPSTP